MRLGLGFVLVAVAAAMLVIGCGGGDETSTLTKAEFVAEGNAICKRAVRDEQAAISDAFAKQPKGGANLTQKEQAALVASAALPVLDEMAAELQALDEPDSEGAEAQRFIDTLERNVEEAEGKPETVVNGDPFTEAKAMAVSLGLTSCAAF
jgi:hypothetical protein